MKNIITIALLILTVTFLSSNAQASAPDKNITTGVSTGITLDKVCATAWGKDIRHVTEAMKQQVFTNYGMTGNDDAKCIPDKNGRRCEIDHLLSRELGGADDVSNLWPQPYGGQCNASQKDRLENKLHTLVCNGSISLEVAQQAIINDWRSAYETYVDKNGCGEIIQ